MDAGQLLSELVKESIVRNVKGKVAWVTGAGTGIGEAAAIALGKAGMKVALTGRRQALLENVAAKIEGDVLVKPADLTDWLAVEQTAREISEEWGRIDVLFNNAGVNIPDRSWSRLSPDGIKTLIDNNLTSVAFCTQAVLPIMRAQGDGQIIHTSSMAGRMVAPVSGPIYTAAKHGVVALSHTINLEECTNGIRSTVVCPGAVATPIMEQRDPPEPAEELAKMVQPSDMAEVIVFLASQPPHVCINEILVTPTHNRGAIAQMDAQRARQKGV